MLPPQPTPYKEFPFVSISPGLQAAGNTNRPLQTKHCCCTGCPSFSGKSCLSQWVNNLFQLQEQWPGVQQKLLTFLSATAKLMHHDPHTLAAWFIYSVCVGARAWGFGRGGRKGEVQTEHLNVIPLIVQLWEGNWNDFAVFQKLHSCPVFYELEIKCPWSGSSQVNLSCLHSRPRF